MMLKNSPERNAVMMILLPIAYIVIGSILVFAKGITTMVFSFILSAALIIGGAAMVIKYFLTRSYLNYSSYGFTGGVLLALLGIIVLLRLEDVDEWLNICLGVCLMLTSVIKLQNSIQLLSVRNRTWIAALCVAVVFIAASVLILADPFKSDEVGRKFTYIMLIIDGVVGLALNIYMYFNAGKKRPAKPVSRQPVEDKKDNNSGGSDTTDVTPLDIDK